MWDVELEPRYPVLMPDDTLCLVLQDVRPWRRRTKETPVEVDRICRFAMGSKSPCGTGSSTPAMSRGLSSCLATSSSPSAVLLPRTHARAGCQHATDGGMHHVLAGCRLPPAGRGEDIRTD
ncbi:hypothetical protein C2845_PM02G44700 [Panicum miliaceum]|uniref:Uncharacterized protein n=1 Tax=Panicum miliaceum TaxID=4540 RepID=A0A3L6S679_PANMI|nr:hypothetical protein C2845_PM02G44700 [Panicum miliaceum]